MSHGYFGLSNQAEHGGLCTMSRGHDHSSRDTTIVVLVDGRIAEVGTHEELIQRQRDYWSLWTCGRDQAPRKRAAHNRRLQSTAHTPPLRSGNTLSPLRGSGPHGPQVTWTGDGPAATAGEDHSTRQRWDVYLQEPGAAPAFRNGNHDGLSPMGAALPACNWEKSDASPQPVTCGIHASRV
jgi:hypothetical protein